MKSRLIFLLLIVASMSVGRSATADDAQRQSAHEIVVDQAAPKVLEAVSTLQTEQLSSAERQATLAQHEIDRRASSGAEAVSIKVPTTQVIVIVETESGEFVGTEF